MCLKEEVCMAGERYTEEFKIAAVKQVTENGYSIADVAKRLGITTKSLYNWRDRYGENAAQYQAKQSTHDELRKLKADLRRVTEERDILKEAAVFFAGESKKNTRS
jgi:transposase